MYAALLIIVVLILLWVIRRKCAKKILWFYRPDCGWCHKMEGEWNKLESAAVFSIYPIDTQRININDPMNRSLALKYNVTQVPFIIKLSKDGVQNVYQGNRSFEDMYDWMRK